MDSIDRYLPSEGEESDENGSEANANSSDAMDDEEFEQQAKNDSDASWYSSNAVDMSLISLRDLSGIVSAVEVDEDPSDVPLGNYKGEQQVAPAQQDEANDAHVPQDEEAVQQDEADEDVMEVQQEQECAQQDDMEEDVPIDLRMCEICGETPCEWIEFKDGVLSAISRGLYQEFPPRFDQVGEDVTVPLDPVELEGVRKTGSLDSMYYLIGSCKCFVF